MSVLPGRDSVSGSVDGSQSALYATRFMQLAAVFLLLAVIAWPVVFSFDLWVLKDRGSLLNLDYLLDEGFHPAVDTYYLYGLLPVLIQRVLFKLFGRGYWPMLACTVVYWLATAALWANLSQHLPRARRWWLAILFLAPILIWINPNFPYCLVQLSLLSSILFVLERRADLALACAAVGCWSVPSLPIAMAGLLGLLIAIEWLGQPQPNARDLIRRFAPGAAVYAAIGLLLVAVFGWASVAATAISTRGAEFYKAVHFSLLGSGREFLFPPNAGVKFYLTTRAGWWIAANLMLICLSLSSLCALIRNRNLDRRHVAILLCASLYYIYVAVAFGPPDQHIIYDPILALGVIMGLAYAPAPARMRAGLFGLFVVLSISSIWSSLGYARWLWKTNTRSAVTAGLYADSAWAAQWSRILDLSTRRGLLFLSYGTGVHHYFPGLSSPDVWFLQEGELLPSDTQRVLKQIQQADIVVQDLTGTTQFFEEAGTRAALEPFCVTSSTAFFRVFERPGSNPVADDRGGMPCSAEAVTSTVH